MNRQGTVTKIEGKYVSVSTQPMVCCSGEGSCSCMNANKFVEFKALKPNDLTLKVGDYVDVRNQAGDSAFGLFRVLVLPLALFFTGYLILPNFVVQPAQWMLFAAGGIGLLLGAAFNLFFTNPKDGHLPVVERVIPVMDVTPLSAQR